MNVVLFSSDLSACSRVSSAASAAGGNARSTSNADQFRQLAAGCDVAVIDLGALAGGEVDVLAALLSLDPRPARIIAFGPHVHTGALDKARAGGCDEVFTRGQFFARMHELLAA